MNTRQILAAFCCHLFASGVVFAQTVTVSRPGAEPVVVPCPAPGCAVQVAVPAVPDPPPPPPPPPPPDPPPPPPPPPPTEGVVFRADYANYPAFGFGGSETEHLGRLFTSTYLPTGGPQGQPAVRLAGVSGAAGQFNWGNRGNINPGVPASGSTFYRFRMKIDGNLRGGPWEGGGNGSGSITNKLLIVGQGCGSNCRFILTYETEAAGIRNFRIQKDGGADLADSGSFPKGQWLDVQVELITSTGTAGGYKIWVNNNTYGAPNAQRTGIRLTNTNHVYTWLGGFVNHGLAVGGTHELFLTDFVISRTFDPTWDR